MKEIITAEMEINEGVTVTIDGYVEYTIDRDYGSDADGNRGMSRTIVEDVTDIAAYDEELGPIALTKEDTEKAGDVLIRKFLEG
jgi:hypothetical protein